MEKLTRETKQIEAAVLKAHADADKIKCLEEVVRYLTLQIYTVILFLSENIC